MLDAEALIGRGHLTALLPRNSRGGRRRRKGREAATEAVAIVALAWMEKQKLTKVRRLWGWDSVCSRPEVGDGQRRRLPVPWQETGGVHFHCPVQ